MKRLLILLPLLFVGLAFQRGARTAAQTVETRAVPADTLITLRREGCEGTCPVYKLTVHGDGRLVYVGLYYVRVRKTVRTRITREQVRQLLDEFEKADYFSLRDSYFHIADGCPEAWIDLPSAYTSIRVGGRKKAVAHSYGCLEKGEGGSVVAVYPRKLHELENKIDEIVGSARWVKGLEDKSRQ